MPARNVPVVAVTHPSGHSFQREISPVPFLIGRSPDCNLVLRDNRISRLHARIVAEAGEYFIEDTGSRHGVVVNGARVRRHRLLPGDRVEFGVPDAYMLSYQPASTDLRRLLAQLPASKGDDQGTDDLARLRSFLEITRAIESALSTDDVLAAVVDAAVAVTRCDRGVLLLRHEGELRVRVARDANAASLDPASVDVPVDAVRQALRVRRELLGMVTPAAAPGQMPAGRVVCVPLVRLRSGGTIETQAISFERETVGVLYMDSQAGADLSGANRELIESLALEASTILENARLLDERREKQRMEEELRIARDIQRGLLPRTLPRDGWLSAAGASRPSSHVGGDYFDVRPAVGGAWSVTVADVSGKGVSAALLASLLQGAFVFGGEAQLPPHRLLTQLNTFLHERTEGEKYATIFCSIIDESGLVQWANAGHCAPILLRASGTVETLDPTAIPAGLLEEAVYPLSRTQLLPGDKLVIYTDGMSEAENSVAQLFGTHRFRQCVVAASRLDCEALVARLFSEVEEYAGGAEQSDDRTLLAIEYRGPQPR